MRPLLALALALLVLVAILPAQAFALAPVDTDESEQGAAELVLGEDVEDEDRIDREQRSSSLDDDVLHSIPELHAPCETMVWSVVPWHPVPEGRIPPRGKRPPRAS